MVETGRAFVIREDGGPSALSFVGELDMAEVPDVRARLAGLDGDLEINCSGVSFIDSSGLSLLVELQRARDTRGAKLLIVDPSGCMTRMLEISGLDALLEVRRNGSAP